MSQTDASISPRYVIPALAAVYVIWGSTYLAMRIAVEGLPPFMMASARFLGTGVVLLLFLRWNGSLWPTRREWLASVPVGTLMFALSNGTVAFAEKRISSGVAAVVCGTMPLWVAALGRFFHQTTTPREWAALILGLVGVVVLASGGELRAEPFSAALLLIAPVSWAVGSLLTRKLPLAKGLMSAATQMLAGGTMTLFISMAVGEKIPLEPPLHSLLALAYLAVFGSLVAYSAYTYLLENTRSAVATSYSYVNPVIAVLMGVVFGGETAGVEVLIAVTLIVIATVLVMKKPQKTLALAVD